MVFLFRFSTKSLAKYSHFSFGDNFAICSFVRLAKGYELPVFFGDNLSRFFFSFDCFIELICISNLRLFFDFRKLRNTQSPSSFYYFVSYLFPSSLLKRGLIRTTSSQLVAGLVEFFWSLEGLFIKAMKVCPTLSFAHLAFSFFKYAGASAGSDISWFDWSDFSFMIYSVFV